jgi:hypothetical protein
MTSQRRVGAVVGIGAAALLLASCGIGVTGGADQVSRSSARLRGDVWNDVAGETTYWFEYGPSPAYGSSTSTETVDVPIAETDVPVEAVVTGLASDSTYHYRLCALDVDGRGSCGADATVTTKGTDAVTGHGVVFSAAPGGLHISGEVDAESDDDGGNPIGTATVLPGFHYFKIEDTGSVTCLRVAGHRAAIGYTTIPFAGEPPISRIAFVEDNGPSGDRWGIRDIPAPATTCPVPTADDFPSFIVGGFDVGSTLISGDFTVVDHPTAP